MYLWLLPRQLKLSQALKYDYKTKNPNEFYLIKVSSIIRVRLHLINFEALCPLSVDLGVLSFVPTRQEKSVSAKRSL